MSAASRPPSSSPYFLITAYGKPNTLCRCCTPSAQAMTRPTSAPRLAKFMPQPPKRAGAFATRGRAWLRRRSLLPGEHGFGLALEVQVGLAADVDRDPLDRAAGEPVRPF